MKINKFPYIFLTIFSACMYSYGGSVLFCFLSGISLCALILSDNRVSAVITALLALAGCVFTSGNTDVMPVFLFNGILPGILLGTGYRKRFSLQYLVVLPACSFVSGWAYTFFSYKNQNGSNMFEDAISTISQSFDSSLAQVSALYGEQLDAETMKLLSEAMASAFETFKLFVPSVIIIYSCIIALLLVWFTGKTALRFGFGFGRSFSTIYAPGTVSLLVMVCFAGVFFSKDNSGFFMNVLAVLLAYYMLCGISLLDFYFRKVLPYGRIRMLIYMVVLIMGSMLLPQFLWSAFMLAGMFDIMFDFRKLRLRFINFDNEK